ncbi:hypothetical protein [Vibrio harveyi]|uniref:hypothetical protein n=1 Tax=Vibrio harveyi TaxID=669 RepID=UPI0025AF5BFA|nr:hypothetical protein [Vibrio harveyi]WJT09270.1 hypothetical protein PH545_24905 [Vibrio harveyi]
MKKLIALISILGPMFIAPNAMADDIEHSLAATYRDGEVGAAYVGTISGYGVKIGADKESTSLSFAYRKDEWAVWAGVEHFYEKWETTETKTIPVLGVPVTVTEKHKHENKEYGADIGALYAIDNQWTILASYGTASKTATLGVGYTF